MPVSYSFNEKQKDRQSLNHGTYQDWTGRQEKATNFVCVHCCCCHCSCFNFCFSVVNSLKKEINSIKRSYSTIMIRLTTTSNLLKIKDKDKNIGIRRNEA